VIKLKDYNKKEMSVVEKGLVLLPLEIDLL